MFGKICKLSSQTELFILCITGGYGGGSSSSRISRRSSTIASGGDFSSTSGYESVGLDEILRYDPASGTWTAAGRMKTPRSDHSVMSLGDISGLC